MVCYAIFLRQCVMLFAPHGLPVALPEYLTFGTLLKASMPMVVTVDGTLSGFSDVQSLKA